MAVPPVLLAAPAAWGQKAPIEIAADLTDAPRRLYHAEIDLPVKPGPLDLTMPQWIPGHQRPTGPAQDIAGVVFTAHGKTLPWRRDDVNLYEFHLTMFLNSRHSDMDSWYSIGLRLGPDGRIVDVRWGGPGDKAKLAPGEKIMAVNGQIFSRDALREAIRAAKDSKEPIHFIVQADEFVRTADIGYHGGERYPVLERVNGTPDYLDDITKPVTKDEQTSATQAEKE